MNRRSFLAALVALPFAPAILKLVPKPVRNITGLEQAMIDAAALAGREHGRPDMVYVNHDTYARLSHYLWFHYGKYYNRDQCATCVQFAIEDTKRRLLAKYRPLSFPNLDGGYNGIWG